MSTFDDYFAALAAADAAAALDTLEQALARGASRGDLVRDIVIPAQQRVGDLWFDGTWTVADEHAATAISEQALARLSAASARDADTLRVVLACAEGEWHTLPARLARGLAEDTALEVIMVGGSVPADHLGRHLRVVAPAALALSCTMPTNLIGAARSIDAAHAAGVPVIVGGWAWGGSQHRARRLGADMWLADATRLTEAVRSVAGMPVTAGAHPVPAEALLLDAVPTELIERALARQSARDAWLSSMTSVQRDRTFEDFGWLARHAAAAVACDDPTIVRDVLSWLLGLLTPRGVPAEAIIDSCDYLAGAVTDDAPRAAGILRDEASRARAARIGETSAGHGAEPSGEPGDRGDRRDPMGERP
ncbi:MAG TPA: B12-binding domain-containing protein [Mycobacteriales bacterium]|nr:B12-binding domain-containing protein [Mycobacteriales bacterium]